MSYIVKNKDNKYLVSFSNVKDNEYVILATDLKQFYLQKVTSEFIQRKFNECDTRIKPPLSKIIKIIREEEPEESEFNKIGNDLNIILKFQMKTTRISDSFKIEFKLKECTSFSEIGELFFSGLLKSIIEEKLKSEGNEKLNVSLPTKSFEAKFKLTESNMLDLCEMIGGEIVSKKDNEATEAKIPVAAQEESSNVSNNTRRAIKRPIKVHKEFKFEQLDDSQELDTADLEIAPKTKVAPNKIVKTPKNPKKKMNIKF